jgi:TonB-dependent receptor
VAKSRYDHLGVETDAAKGLRLSLKAGASLVAVGTLLASAGAYAQDNAPPANAPQAADSGSGSGDSTPIVVSGIRQSLATAQNIKRNSDTVVDAITAQDIGALPDRSVTEALQRVPGVEINRFAGSNDPDHFSVEGSGVAIRGLTFVRSEFNGRTSFAAGVYGQALNFADVPSELLGSVIVAKNSTAEMIEGGLAGTVNLNTRKPFDNKGLHVAFDAEANYGDFRKAWTPTFSGLVSDTWETSGGGTFGILVSGSYSRIKSRADGAQVSNFQTRDNTRVLASNTSDTLVCRNPLPTDTDTLTLPPAGSDCGTAEGPGADGFADYADVRYAPVGGQFRTQRFDRKRDGISAAAQFETADHGTVVTAEYIRSHSTADWNEYTFETSSDLSDYNTYPLGCRQNANGPISIDSSGHPSVNASQQARAQCPMGNFQNYVYDSNNLFQSGYITNPNNGWRGPTNNYDARPARPANNPYPDGGLGGGSPYVPIGGMQSALVRRMVHEETLNQDWSINLKSDVTDHLTLWGDAQYAKSHVQNLDFGIWGSNFTDQELDLTGNVPVIIPHKPSTLGYTWSAPSPELAAATDETYFTDPHFQFWRSAMDHIENSTGDQLAFKGDAEYKFDDSSFIRSVKAGARYSDVDQTVRYTTYNWGMLSEVWSGTRPITAADTPAQQVNFYSFPNFFRGQVPGPPGGYYYNGNLTDDYAGGVDFAHSIEDLARTFGGSPTWNQLSDRPGVTAGTPYLPSEIQPIHQKDLALYTQINFASDDALGSVRFSGNIGVRWVSTHLKSSGVIGIGTQQALGINQPYDDVTNPDGTVTQGRCRISSRPFGSPSRPGGVCNLGPAGYAELQDFVLNSTPQAETVKNHYDYFLPSMNLKFGLSDDLLLRFAVSKVLTRPENGYIRDYFTAGLDTTGNLTATAGDPTLKPATAWQFDLTGEWYFARVGSLTFDLFYKDIKNFFYQNVRTESFVNDLGDSRDVIIRGPANYDGHGKVKGFELAYQQTYDFLPGPLSGLGMSANYTYIDSSGLPNSFLNGGSNANTSPVPPGKLPLEQLSKHNFNIAAFYEKGPLSIRAAYNWRSKFLLTASDVIIPYFSIFNASTGQLDGSIFFNVSKNIKIGVQGVNLLNEVTKTLQAYTGDPHLLAPRSYFMNDRRYSFIVRGSF